MQNLIIVLNSLSQNNRLAIVVWVLLCFILSKISEIFLHERLLKSGIFGGDKNRVVFLEVLGIGVMLLFLASVSRFLFSPNFIWFVISIAVIIGGLLGIVPFYNKPRQLSSKENDNLRLYMVLGGIVGFLIAFCGAFFFVYCKNPDNAAIGIILGLVVGLIVGNLIGIVGGYFVGKYLLLQKKRH